MAVTTHSKTPEQSSAATLRIAFLLQPHFSLLAFTAAADALTTANLVIGTQRFQFQAISLNHESVISDLGIPIPCTQARVLNIHTHRPQPTLQNVQADVLIVCGGHRCNLSKERETTELIQAAAHQKMALGGIWNGVFSLAHAGLMNGYGCALHPDSQAKARTIFPQLDIREDTIVIDRNRFSAAGPNSAFELILVLIQRHDSAGTVQQIRQILRMDSIAPESANSALHRDDENHYPMPLRLALQLMRSNFDEPLNKQELAGHIKLSTRAMERLFQRHLNTSPAKHYMHLRLQRANELITHTDQSIGEISDACGFVSSAHFSRAFNLRYECAPSTLRKSISSRLNTQ